MKTLTLIRHAKSSWEFDVIDHDRPLKTRGITDAELISKSFKENMFKTDLVLVSDAKRTRQTAEIFHKNLKFSTKKLNFEHDLYDFSGEKLTEVIKNCNDFVQNLMVFGHNYAITNFVNTYGSISFDNVPTCGLIQIDFDIVSWKDLKRGETKLYLFPKDLKS